MQKIQKGKAAASPPPMVFQGRPPQQNLRGPPSMQQRPDDFNARQPQTFQLPTQMPQNIVMGQIPGQMQTPQGQPRMPNQQQFYHGQRPMRIPRHQKPNNPPMYASPPGPPMTVQMIGPGPPPFIPPGQNPQFIPQHVEYTQIPVGGPPQMQYRPQQGMFLAQNFEPRARERKIIQIKDPNSNKDIPQEIEDAVLQLQEIVNYQPSGRLTGSTTGTPNNSTPDISGQSSNSSTPPLTIQQQAEANVRAQFAAQVAATLANDSEEKLKKVAEYTIQKALVNYKTAALDSGKIKEVADMSKDKVAKEAKISSTVNVSETQLNEKPVENVVETQPKEEVGKRPKEAVQGSKLNDRVSVEKSLGAKSVSSVDLDAITSTKGIMSNDIVEIFRADDMCNKEQSHKEAQQSSAAASDVKTAVEPAKETAEPAGRGPPIRRKGEQEENLQRQLREMEEQLISLQKQCTEKELKNSNLDRQLRDRDQDLVEVRKTLSETERKLEKCKCQEKRDWIIPRDDISITDKSLGRGAWGYVHEGKYCGCTVAVKKLHEKDLISPCNRGKFEREMDIASRCRHPCLLQFIGATNDEESPLFVTELMELSLRQLLNKRPLFDREVVTISLDVARALSYLHKKRPSPILHRDVSSPNVLLWRRGNQWRAKVSDYGTANFLQDTMTANPGAMIYSAPEACARTQTVKIDVYSFGVLLCEMCTREMPEPDRRDAQVQLVKTTMIQALVRRCVQSAAEDRPSMEEIIEELEQLNGTS